jgi:alpha,alpha-trehalase
VKRRDFVRTFSGLLACILLAALSLAQPAPKRQTENILDYIRRTWAVLTRSNRDLAAAAVDPKFHPEPSGRWPVYIARTENLRRIERQLRKVMPAGDIKKIVLRRLPQNLSQMRDQGLLYLPYPYVVPGGRFNEMYGWDSYFIQVGLLRDNDIDLAKNMADNFLYEIRHYGKILNANRTYYLHRSQPPFLTQMLLGVYEKTHDAKWLASAVRSVEAYYRFWTSEPHLTPDTGLSRYYSTGEGPAPEVVSAERDAQGRTHYDLVKEYYRTHKVTAYDVTQYYDPKTDTLTPLFYKGDRSMRESGFDPSDRYGPFSVDIIHYDPVDLNCLLYLMETQTAEILRKLGRVQDAHPWEERADDRAEKINRLMWDARDGLYCDYNFTTKRVRRYPFLTTFYPLWAGIASRAQAARVVSNLDKFERAGGLQTSTTRTGNQWDAPFGWAPLHMIAVDGLRRYGYNREADRIAMKFLSLVLAEFRKTGVIVEKYNVVDRSANLSGAIQFGYRSNEAGFGWTNAAFTHLLDELSAAQRRQVLERPAALRIESGPATPLLAIAR